MRRYIAGLHAASADTEAVPDGLYMVQVRQLEYHWHANNPFYLLRFVVLEPKSSATSTFTGRLYCCPKALWKLVWFLRDFGYDSDLLANDEIDQQWLIGLRGVVKIGHITVHGTPVLNLEGFAPAQRWRELSLSSVADAGGLGPEVAS